MPDSSEPTFVTDVIDAIADYVAANSGIEKSYHETRYKMPVLILPEDCPVLTIALGQEQLSPRTTNQFDTSLFIVLTWWEEMVASVEDLVRDPDRARSMLLDVTRIKRCLMRLANTDWELLGAYDVLPVSVDYTPGPEVEAGAVEGYAVTVQVNIQQRSV